MDRFIEGTHFTEEQYLKNLKSSMDRFIAHNTGKSIVHMIYLKSSMDRFIVVAMTSFIYCGIFKIQYG